MLITAPVTVAFAIERRMQGDPVVHVQVSKQGVAYCGTVEEFSSRNGTDYARVRTQYGVGWWPVHRVRTCSGVDGRCICEASPSC